MHMSMAMDAMDASMPMACTHAGQRSTRFIS